VAALFFVAAATGYLLNFLFSEEPDLCSEFFSQSLGALWALP
jgi:hypothetical protein